MGLSKNLLYLSALKFKDFHLPFHFSWYIFCGTVQSVLWECCSHCFHWSNRITLWPEGECTTCTFNGCHNGLEWKIAVYLWPKVQPLCIQGHGILGPWVLAVEFCEHEISSFMCHFFIMLPLSLSFSAFLQWFSFPSLIWPEFELQSVHAYGCVCVCMSECVLDVSVFS